MSEGTPGAESTATEAALRVAADVLEREHAETGTPPSIGDVSLVQRLLGALVKSYAASVDAGAADDLPFVEGGPPALVPTPTEICITASKMLEAGDIEVFELAMWRTWASVGGPHG